MKKLLKSGIKLLKSEICESVNSARMHCLLWKSQQVRAEPKKKKKKKEICRTKTQMQQSVESKHSLYIDTHIYLFI